MKHRPRLPHESSPLKKFFVVCSILALALLVLGGFWFLSKMGPRDVDYREVAVVGAVTDELLEFKAQSIELEAEFDELVSLREPEAEDIELIRKARDLQKAYVEGTNGLDGEAAQRLRALTVRYENNAAAKLQERSFQIEMEAQALAENKDYEAASTKYQEAFALQDEINQSFSNSSAYNAGVPLPYGARRFFLRQSLCFKPV